MLPLVSIKDVSVSIPGQNVQRDVLSSLNLDIADGEHTAIHGANGSGKTTLLRLVHGDLWPRTGSIAWRGVGGHAEKSRIIARMRTALISPLLQEQIQRLNNSLTAYEWLTSDFSLDPLLLTGKNLQNQAQLWLKRLDIVDLSPYPLSALSQGQLRLLMLARAFLRKPALLLLDEYADGLDTDHMSRIEAGLEELRKETTMLFVTHRKKNLPDWCRRELLLEDGNLHRYPAPSYYTHTTQPKEAERDFQEPVCSSILFDIKNASVYRGEQSLLKNIDWRCHAGEHWRIGGSNGAGKTTFLRLLAGDEMVALGGIFRIFNPHTKQPARSLSEKRSLVQLVSDQQQACYGYNVSGLELVCSGWDNSTGIYRQFSREEREEAQAAINFFFPDENADYIARSAIRCLSSGQLRRLFLARSLISKPCALLLDEPFSLLDAKSRELTKSLLQELATRGWQESRITIIFVSHHAEDLPACVTREAVLRNGRLSVLK